MRHRVLGVCLGAVLGLVVVLAPWVSEAGAQTPGLPVVPIVGDPRGSSVAPFEGTPAFPNPIPGVPAPPQSPFMAPNGLSNIHNDAYMTDTYRVSGPLGDGLEISSLFARECASVTFDSQGRIVTICVGLDRPVLALLDPHTLQTLAAMPLLIRNLQSGSNPFTDFSGGGYFYLDSNDHAVLSTNDRHLLEVAITSGPSFTVVHDYDLSGAVPADDGIVSALPDWGGRLWFVSRNGIVGTVDRVSGAIHTTQLSGEGISNSFAVDETGGVYIVSDRALYRFDPGAGGTDNADPMDVQVYRRAASVRGSRLVCSEPVFRQGASSTDQSLIGTDHSLIAENNYGYSGITATMNGGVTEPGLTRVDVSREGCRTVWTSDERAPSVVPKLSLANGLVYTYTKPQRPDGIDAWYLTALDFRSGRTVYRRLAGTGFGYNNNYAPVSIAPDGTAYVGVLGGLVEFP